MPDATLKPTAKALSPGLPAEPLEIFLVREILANSDGIPVSPYKVDQLFNAASDMANGGSTRENGKTLFVDFARREVTDTAIPEVRKTFVELAIREALTFAQFFEENERLSRFNASFGFEIHRLVVKELAILLQEWDELTGQAPSKEVV